MSAPPTTTWTDEPSGTAETPHGSLEPAPMRPHRPPVALILVAFLVIVPLAVASALFVSSREPTVHGARADIIFVFTDGTPHDSRERVLSTQESLLRSRAVLASVARRNEMSYEALADAVSVDTGLSDVLEVTVADEDAQVALALIHEVADSYLDAFVRLAPSRSRAEALLNDELDSLRARIRRASGDDEIVLRDRAGRVRDRLLDLQIRSEDRDMPKLVSQPYLLNEPLSPRRDEAIALGLIVGLLLATGVALVLARLVRGPR